MKTNQNTEGKMMKPRKTATRIRRVASIAHGALSFVLGGRQYTYNAIGEGVRNRRRVVVEYNPDDMGTVRLPGLRLTLRRIGGPGAGAEMRESLVQP